MRTSIKFSHQNNMSVCAANNQVIILLLIK